MNTKQKAYIGMLLCLVVAPIKGAFSQAALALAIIAMQQQSQQEQKLIELNQQEKHTTYNQAPNADKPWKRKQKRPIQRNKFYKRR